MNMIHRYTFLVMVVLLGVTSTSLAIEGTWTRKADMPTARLCPSTCVVDGKIYAIGGATSIHGTYLPTVEVYDPVTDSWTRKTDMPTRRNGLATAVVNGKIYAIGGEPTGQASLGTVEEYDPLTDAWTRKADMPTKRTFHCVCTVDEKIYAFSGVTAGVPGAIWNPSTLEVYDPATDTWVTKRSMLTPRGLAGACEVNGKIYVMGGVVGSTHNPSLSTVEAYDPETDTWMTKANLPTARSFPALCAVNGRVYAIGGGTYGGATFSTVEIYDPVTDSWKSGLDMPTARLGFSTSVVNARIYAIGGARDFYPSYGLSIVEEYDLTPPPPDFNGDGLVDIKDLLRLIGSWDQDDPGCDIAPSPFGDGIVDALDLELLMSYWEQPIDDPTLISHWALDEAEGDIAYDSAGVNDAFVMGGTAWQPSGGQIDGALQLDGVDGCAVAGPVLNPADGPFSVLAWIQCGAPGQVVLSQSNGANWLRADSATGCLMTELCAWGRNGSALHCDVDILDGNWRRVGFVWDGFNRSLYVDDILAAEDTQEGLASATGGLNIGCGMNSAAGTYWSGLIDEIRIYNRVVSP